MCFSFDGWALAVGHEGALTVWSTEDGTRLVCTTSDSRSAGGKQRGGGGEAYHQEGPPADNQAPPPTGKASATGEANGGGPAAAAAAATTATAEPTPAAGGSSGTLDLIAGGASALTWECEGYRLMSVGGAVLGGGMTGGEGEGGGGGEAVQGIVAFDFLRRARSNLSSALLSLQVIFGVPYYTYHGSRSFIYICCVCF